MVHFFFFKQKTAYEVRISDWSSDVCSSDLARAVLNKIPDFHIGINFSSLDLQAKETLPYLIAVLSQAGIAPGNIMVEATEHGRSEERRVGKECVSTCRSRW